jgi:hypothetical protein
VANQRRLSKTLAQMRRLSAQIFRSKPSTEALVSDLK